MKEAFLAMMDIGTIDTTQSTDVFEEDDEEGKSPDEAIYHKYLIRPVTAVPVNWHRVKIHTLFEFECEFRDHMIKHVRKQKSRNKEINDSDSDSEEEVPKREEHVHGPGCSHSHGHGNHQHHGHNHHQKIEEPIRTTNQPPVLPPVQMEALAIKTSEENIEGGDREEEI